MLRTTYHSGDARYGCNGCRFDQCVSISDFPQFAQDLGVCLFRHHAGAVGLAYLPTWPVLSRRPETSSTLREFQNMEQTYLLVLGCNLVYWFFCSVYRITFENGHEPIR